MKVSYQWLQEHLEINESPEKVADTITLAGLEVEKIVKTGIGNVNVVSVEILEVKKHPDANNLFITIVDAGKLGEKQIITNVAGLNKGQKLLAALEGVKLATGMEIKKFKLKGIESEGMFVGWEELGIPQKSEDLFYLDSTVVNGTNYNEIFPFNDKVIDIELTANRGDCLGMIGVAREVKTLFGVKEKKLDIEYKTIDKKIEDNFKVVIESKNCLRYCGGLILDVDIRPSPYWMQLRLIKAGIRPINNVVDITNYILLECNQPLHAFDMDKIKDKKMIIRDARDNEKTVTLDDIERKLEKDDIVITDINTIHCIGGVMGCQISEVTDSTKNIFLEAAFFNPVNIRKTSKRTELISESSYRFERGIDKERVDWSLKRALYLFDKLKVGKICKGIIDVYPGKTSSRKVLVTAEWINNKLGTDIPEKIICEILVKLGFNIKIQNNDIEVIIPSWRNDISIKEDIAEEVARIYGYNKIKHSLYPSYQAAARTPLQVFEKTVRELLYKAGCDETINMSFLGNSLFDKMLLSKDHHFRNIIYFDDPLTEDWAGLRNSLIPGMLRTARYNITRNIKTLSLFEIGNINLDIKGKNPLEEKKLSVLLAGFKKDKDYISEEIKFDFYDIKGIVDYIFDYFQIEVSFEKSNEVFLHPYQQAKILLNKKDIGILGKLDSMVCESLDINVDLFICEISIKEIFEHSFKKISYKEIPRFPSSSRDLALVVSNSIKAGDIINTVKSSNIGILQNVKVFDIYSGKNIEEGKYSIAITMDFNKNSSTLTDNEVDNAVNKILKNLKEKCNAVIRE